MEIMPPIEGMDPLQQAMRTLEADLEAQGWDAKPTFYILQRPANLLAVSPLQVPDMVTEDPSSGLPLFAAYLSGMPLPTEDGPQVASYEDRMETLRLMAGPNFYGIAMFTEGWTVPDADSRIEEFATRTVHEAPDRIEIRYGIAVTTMHEIVRIHRIRGEIPEYQATMDDYSPQGRVPDSLRVLCWALAAAVKANNPGAMRADLQ